MSAEDLEQYESELELQLYREYKDVVGIFTYAVETERRFYLCNAVDLKVRTEGGDVYYEVSMGDAWVWDMYRPARFVKSAKVLTFRDVSIEEIAHSDLEVPKPTDQLRPGHCESRVPAESGRPGFHSTRSSSVPRFHRFRAPRTIRVGVRMLLSEVGDAGDGIEEADRDTWRGLGVRRIAAAGHADPGAELALPAG